MPALTHCKLSKRLEDFQQACKGKCLPLKLQLYLDWLLFAEAAQ